MVRKKPLINTNDVSALEDSIGHELALALANKDSVFPRGHDNGLKSAYEDAVLRLSKSVAKRGDIFNYVNSNTRLFDFYFQLFLGQIGGAINLINSVGKEGIVGKGFLKRHEFEKTLQLIIAHSFLSPLDDYHDGSFESAVLFYNVEDENSVLYNSLNHEDRVFLANKGFWELLSGNNYSEEYFVDRVYFVSKEEFLSKLLSNSDLLRPDFPLIPFFENKIERMLDYHSTITDYGEVIRDFPSMIMPPEIVDNYRTFVRKIEASDEFKRKLMFLVVENRSFEDKFNLLRGSKDDYFDKF